MRKQCAILISLIMIMGVVVGCSTKTESFDDENIIFSVVDTQSNKKSETIKITNETGFDLDNLTMKLSYPLNTENNSDNTSEMKTVNSIEEFNIKSGETKELSVPLSFDENLKSVDLDNPHIELKGNVVEGNEKVPFGVVGALSALIEKP
ncbi:hypothetical protein [Terrihalobacillus insolitus]|uniref:hypothetical protein n=1 Tax=Terrihalobacillus insolitus TaxID=2950438 RepID=UPI002341A39F|nr:hypothetical protein [Terrihalobacillus insolitus]MDC3413168.1 hypothetical protein [Terrihalobacillus insolitus]